MKYGELTQQQGVMGFVECDAAGEVIESVGDEADLLGNVLVYFQQTAALIGESLGLDELLEAQIMGKSLTVLAVPAGEGTVGVIVNSKARIPALLEQVEVLTASKGRVS